MVIKVCHKGRIKNMKNKKQQKLKNKKRKVKIKIKIKAMTSKK